MTEEAMPDEDALDDVLAAALELDLLTEADLDVLTDKIAEGETTCSAALAEWRPKFEAAVAATSYQYVYAVVRFFARSSVASLTLSLIHI